jgi:hypothetical protein
VWSKPSNNSWGVKQITEGSLRFRQAVIVDAPTGVLNDGDG